MRVISSQFSQDTQISFYFYTNLYAMPNSRSVGFHWDIRVSIEHPVFILEMYICEKHTISFRVVSVWLASSHIWRCAIAYIADQRPSLSYVRKKKTQTTRQNSEEHLLDRIGSERYPPPNIFSNVESTKVEEKRFFVFEF